MRGRCLPYEEQTGYQAFALLVKEASGIFESDPLAVAREKLGRAVAELLPPSEADDDARYLALLLGLAAASDDGGAPPSCSSPPAASSSASGSSCRRSSSSRTSTGRSRASSSCSSTSPTHVRDTAVVLIALARPELLDAQPTWGAASSPQTTIPLEPLRPRTPPSSRAALIGEVGGRTADVGRVVEVAEGNPLFLEELAASVPSSGDGRRSR